ncbi:GEVED domain-containing protein [Spirillospora sp. NPDC050679]
MRGDARADARGDTRGNARGGAQVDTRKARAAGRARAELPFKRRYAASYRGALARAGNTVLSCYPPAVPDCADTRNGGGPNNIASTFVDSDGQTGNSTFNSSSADLSVPAGAEVRIARLYWGGRSETRYGTPYLPLGNKLAPDISKRGTVRFKPPGASAYLDITADAADIGTSATAVTGYAYGASADVTALVRSAGGGAYTVADVQAARGYDELGAFGGWTLVVAYSDARAPLRNLALFDGYLYQEAHAAATDVDVSGFQTPENGPVTARLGEVVFDGDRTLTGDSLSVKTTNGPRTTLTDAAHPADDFFNSSIATLGRNETARTPAYSNQLGYDSSTVDASSAFRNGDTSARFSFSTQGDTYWPQALFTQIDLNQPKIELTKTARVVGGGPAKPGSTVEYTVTATSKGPDDAVETVLTDRVPARTAYVPGSLRIASGANAGGKTGEPGDDQGEIAGDGLTVRLGTGADADAGGRLDVGETTSVTFRVTLDDPGSAGTTVTNTARIDYGGADFPSERTYTTATAETPVAGVRFEKTATPEDPRPGGKVTYTVKASNPTAVDYTGATFTDDLTGVLDDAAYGGDAKATAGKVSYAEPDLTWTGDVPAGETVTITYSVTVGDPPTGDLVLRNAIASTSPGSNCPSPPPATGADPACGTELELPKLEVAKSADPTDPRPGEKVTYTVTVRNVGKAGYKGATFTDDLTKVLDDAAYDDDAKASTGEVSYTAPKLTWTGDLAVGDVATVTYSVTVKDPPSGDGELENQVVAPGSNCKEGTDPDCSAVVLLPKLRIKKTASPSKAKPGERVTYTVTVRNVGKAEYKGAAFTDDLTEVLDDADYDDDARATAGDVSYTAPKVTWTGDLAVGDIATVTYSVTVKSPPAGDGGLVNAVTSPGSNCADGTGEDCSTEVPTPRLHVVKRLVGTRAKPGSALRYQIIVTNDGRAAFEGAVVTDDLSGTLDDADYNGDAGATAGKVSYAEPELTWTGDVAPGDRVVITYSVTAKDPPAGDNRLKNAVVSAGSNCVDGTEPDCHVEVLEPDLHYEKTAEPAEPGPGGKVTYTVTVTNTGTDDYTDAAFSDDLRDVLDDAVYNGDATADSGRVDYDRPVLRWRGDVPVGGKVRIVYSVTLRLPGAGDGQMTNVVVSDRTGDNCEPGSADPDCTAVVPVPRFDFGDAPDSYGTRLRSGGPFHAIVPGLTLGSRVTPEPDARGLDALSDTGDDGLRTVAPLVQGRTSHAQDLVLVNRTGRTALVAGWIDFDRDGRFEPAERAQARVAPGAVRVRLTWPRIAVPAPGRTYARFRIYGDQDRVAAEPGPAGYGGSGEVEDHPLTIRPAKPGLSVVKRADRDRVRLGGTVRYTVTVTNTGRAPFTPARPAVVTDDLRDVLDDARYNGDARATAGRVSYRRPVLTWKGPLAPGQRAVITYSVTVRDRPKGDTVLRNTVTGAYSNCAPGDRDGRCRTETRVRIDHKRVGRGRP